MKAISIDFAPHSAKRALARTGPLAWLLACAGLAICASGTMSAFDLIRQRDALQVDRRHAEKQLTEHAAHKPVPKKLVISDLRAGAVNAAIEQLNLPWRDLFDAFEAATPTTIALLALEPDAKKHLVKGLAEAKTDGEMIAYIEQLKRQPSFESAVLTRHEINEQDPNKPIRFQFEVRWTEDMR